MQVNKRNFWSITNFRPDSRAVSMKRFSNPHLSVQHIKLSSRSEIFGDLRVEEEPIPEISSLIGQLDEIVQQSLDTTVTFDDSRSRKRRKLNTEQSETQQTPCEYGYLRLYAMLKYSLQYFAWSRILSRRSLFLWIPNRYLLQCL